MSVRCLISLASALALVSCVSRPPDLPPGESIDGVMPKEFPIVERPRPVYPPELVAEGISGSVVVSFVLSSYGDVSQIKIVETTDRRFNKAAIAAVQGIKARPWKTTKGTVKMGLSTRLQFSPPATR
ncbi:MAG: TonB family protein [Luteolibacter sp.]